MKTQNIIIAHPKDIEQSNVIKAFMEALKIKFEISEFEDSPYDEDFVNKINQSKKEFNNGEFSRIAKDSLQNFLGL